jgi:hypothetical protein
MTNDVSPEAGVGGSDTGGVTEAAAVECRYVREEIVGRVRSQCRGYELHSVASVSDNTIMEGGRAADDRS